MKKLPLLIVFGLLLVHHSLAGTITVTSLNDNGAGTLRDAIAAAAPNDTINFGVTGTIVLTNGELFINKSLIISGPGPGMLTVQRSTAAGTADFRIFNIAAGTVAISGLAVNNGRAPIGGGIINDDVLILSNCVVIGNVATNVTGAEGKGGGIKNSRTGTLTVRQSIISSNAAAGGAFTGFGGAFYNDNTMAMTDSTVHGNVASGGAGAQGGGMVNGFSAAITNSSFRFNSATGDSGASGQTGVGGGILNAGTLLLTECTASDNTATGGAGTSGDGGSVRGGGIANGIGGTVELQRCTVSGNLAMGGNSSGGNGGSSQGGGISGDIGSTTRMTNSTISGNTAKAGAGGTTFNVGGGIFGDASTVTTFYSTITSNTVPNGSATDGGGICVSNGSAVEIKSTILAANNAMVDIFLDDSSSYDSSGFNLIGTTNGLVAPPGPNDQFNVSGAALNLGPLQNNGGPTFTHALLCGSIAINAGASAGAPPTDQRGFPRIVGSAPDVGSFESSADTTPPTITCPSMLMVGTDPDQCSKSNVTYAISSSASVACMPPSGSTFPIGDTVVQCVATDACGNTNACAFLVKVMDMQPPAITCPPDIITSADAGQSSKSNVTYTATATDNCPGVSVACNPPSGSTFPVGMNTVMCTATDASINSASCNFRVVIGTNQLPMIQCPADILATTDSGQCSRSNVTFAAMATNSSPGVTVSCMPPSGSTFPKGTNIVTCTATDMAGLSNQCSFLVIVNDTEPPALTCPANFMASTDTGQCSKSNVTYTVTATDNCPGVTVNCSPASGATFPRGTNTVLCTATDAAGNATQCSFLVIVDETEPPAILCPPDIVASPDSGQSSKSNVTYTVTATDNCPGVSVTCIPPSGSTFPRGTNLVTCTATDAAGNVVMCSFRVIILDNEAPVIQCPADITTGTDAGQCSKSNVTYVVTATDNDPGVSVTCNPPPGSTFPKGTNQVTCTATDAMGLTTQCRFLIIVQDTEPPTIACPADILANPDPGQCSKSNVMYGITAGDNCPGVSVSCTPAEGSMFAVGTNTVTCTATDGSGQTASCSFRVIVQVIPLTVSFNVSADCPTNLLPSLSLQSNSMICLVVADNEPFSFYRATLSNVPPGFVVQNGSYPGWCVDYAGGLTTNEVYKPAFLYLSHGPLPPQLQNPNWDRVNYILNHKQGDSFDLQAAIWHFIGGPIPQTDTRFVPLSSIASNIIADATANGAGFVPGPGEISAIVLDLGTDAQTNIIEVVCPRGLQLCAGTNFTLCATVTGTGPLTFRWTKDGVTIPGASSNCLTLTNVSAADAGRYCLEVTGACNNVATACVSIGVVNCSPAPAPLLRALAVMSTQDIEIKVDGERGRSYAIEASFDLVNWRRITTAINTDGTLRFADPDRGNKCFYRVMMEP